MPNAMSLIIFGLWWEYKSIYNIIYIYKYIWTNFVKAQKINEEKLEFISVKR